MGENFANHIPDKRLIYKIYKESYNSIANEKQSNLKVSRFHSFMLSPPVCVIFDFFHQSLRVF